MKIAPICGVFGGTAAIFGARAWERGVLMPALFGGFLGGVVIYFFTLSASALAMALSEMKMVKETAFLRISVRIFLIVSGVAFTASPFFSAWLCHVAASSFL